MRGRERGGEVDEGERAAKRERERRGGGQKERERGGAERERERGGGKVGGREERVRVYLFCAHACVYVNVVCVYLRDRQLDKPTGEKRDSTKESCCLLVA